MTLCVSWIRKVNNREELIFATDSELRGGGEKWDKGVKLFEMPNKDALLSFTGSTSRAYPLILNLISSINYDDLFFKDTYTLDDLKEHIIDLFSSLIKTISDFVEDKHKVRGEARFLFGGWDWDSSQFRIWYLLYDDKSERFIANELTDDSEKNKFHVFIGEVSDDKIDIEEIANERLTKTLIEENRLYNNFDMEPIKILRDIALDKEVIGVGGSLQIAKVYKSNKTEFFGTYWQSSKGKPYFQGVKYDETKKPLVRYFDPDSFEIIESEIPYKLKHFNEDDFGDDFQFVNECYEKGFLKENLSENKKHRLKTIFKDVAFRLYIKNQEEPLIEE
jgi:hypothetical protein